MKLTPEQIFSIFLVAAGGLIGLISGVLGAVVNSIFTSRRDCTNVWRTCLAPSFQ